MNIERSTYALEDTENLISPALVYYKDIIFENTRCIIDMAGKAEQLWPHVKSHKTSAMIRMQIGLGINKFKCATIAEAEMTAQAGGAQIILAYQLVGPNIKRYLKLAKAFPQTIFYAIGDNFEQLSVLSKEASGAGMKMNVLIDVDMGMHRTGVALDSLKSLYEKSALLPGITLKGMHCYDGQRKEQDVKLRTKAVEENDRLVLQIQESLKQKGLDCDIMVMGGTPSFPCRSGREGFYLSPGTLFIGDWGYYSRFPDLDFYPGAAVFCRVVSHGSIAADSGADTGSESRHTFTLDLGNKGIAADPAGERGIIAGLEQAKTLFQSEEHWVFSLPKNIPLPPIGSEHYVIPTHICPTSALYPEIQVAQGGKITEQWQVDARNRKINY